MSLRIFNSLSRRKERFSSSNGSVKLFVCGPTVYDYVHLGHARTYIAFDIIARYLAFSGYKVSYLMNLTDVAEKIVKRAKDLKKAPLELAREYEQAFLEDMRSLNIVSVDHYERASDHIPQIIDQIKGMTAKGMAYETNTGVYFEVKKFPKFGALSGVGHEELGLRRFELCSSKRNPEDFSLWRKHERGFGWESPWGFGRPGWHVEDTAISMATFGDTYDLHGGASELMFPHHEAEIAQAEALTGKQPFVRFWLHTGLLTTGGRKMSKSLGNVIRIRDALKEYSAQELRYYFGSFHYREPVRISDAALRRARNGLQSFAKNFNTFVEAPEGAGIRNSRKLASILYRAESAFRRHMNNDFDTPSALRTLVALSKQLKSFTRDDSRANHESRARIAENFRKMASVFGILPD